jgi:ribonuclease HII
VIDSCGIREANRLAMLQSLQEIQSTKYPVLRSSKNWEWITTKDEKIQNEGIRLLIDGRDKYQFDIVWLPLPEYIVRGDSKIKQIMAASILAKVTRDTLMQDFEKQFPGYWFAQHKGYGTQLHQETLQKLGVSEIHRRSYKPIQFLNQQQ